LSDHLVLDEISVEVNLVADQVPGLAPQPDPPAKIPADQPLSSVVHWPCPRSVRS